LGKSKPPQPDRPAAPFHNPFGGVAERLGITPSPAASPSAAPTSAASARDAGTPSRAVIRIERKGRGGKEATVVDKLELPLRDLERWALELKRALGCGGGVEGETLVLHGDQRARAKAWLEARGVRKVTVG
jgi:translation initiation factor 1